MQFQIPKKVSDKEKAYRTLKGNAVILFLYILLQPDYAYNIAKNFDKMGPNPKGKKKYPWTLARVSNVQTLLKKLTKVGLLNKVEKDVKDAPWRKRVYYDVNMAIFDFGELYSNPNQKDVISKLMTRYIQIMDGKTKGALLKDILKLEKPDYITVLLFYKQLLLSLNNNTSEIYLSKYIKELHNSWEGAEKLLETFPSEVKASIAAWPVVREYTILINDIILERVIQERGFPILMDHVEHVKHTFGETNDKMIGYDEYCEKFADIMNQIWRDK